MRVLFCHIGFMNLYDGTLNNEKPMFGGKYNETNIGHEVYNFSNYNGRYFGFAQNSKSTIEVNKLLKSKDEKRDKVDNVLVVWCAKKPKGNGVYVVGWYRNATVYRNLQSVPEDVLEDREDKEKNCFNIFSENAILVPTNERSFQVEGIGRYVWYGNKTVIEDVVKYIEDYENRRNNYIKNISENFDNLNGDEKEAVIKVRLNQEIFRTRILKKYKNTCCVSGCNITVKELLIASHIKPWKNSNGNEKVNDCNGLLLCVMHDRLFDRGFISFDDKGKILISSRIDKNNRMFANIDENRTITVNSDNKKFLKYHRENIFIK